MHFKQKPRMKQSYLALGLMSGTSCDGIDISLIRTDGDKKVQAVAFETFPYRSGFQSLLRACASAKRRQDPHFIDYCEKRLTFLHIEAVKKFLQSRKVKSSNIDLVGFHGHTIAHGVCGKHFSHQIGNGSLLAKKLGIDVINDFRSNDIAKGGQGAPLAPIFHTAIIGKRSDPSVFVNVGGISNVTWIDSNRECFLGFDAGPGNTLLDRLIQKFTGELFDRNGGYAAMGRVQQSHLRQFLSKRHFRRKPPKSFDVFDFNFDELLRLSIEDGAATLTAITAHAIFMAQDYFPKKARHWLICGGGRKNKSLLSMLRGLVEADSKANMSVSTVEKIGWDGDAIESQAFAYLAVRSAKGLPLTFPLTTGVSKPTKGGVFHSKD